MVCLFFPSEDHPQDDLLGTSKIYPPGFNISLNSEEFHQHLKRVQENGYYKLNQLVLRVFKYNSCLMLVSASCTCYCRRY